MSTSLSPEMFDHYGEIDEAGRLSRGVGELERIRTQDLIGRRLPQSPSIVLDVGGAAGVHALWLARQGHEVHLIDPVPHHVEQARQASAAQVTHPLASCTVGDARNLDYADACADAVLLLGPLYHLTERADRLKALSEAYRVLRPGGLMFVAAISRFASFLSGMTHGLLSDPVFVEIIRQDLKDGQHRNPTNNPQYFTTTFFHHPDELRTEVEETGFSIEKLAAIEGPVMWMKNFDADWEDVRRRALLLEFLDATEEEPAFIGTSSHFLAIGCK
ncbi:class I SAM-dependent methyltransferase [Chelativorans alearense]|uniref:class I SAM-dependent methyltransferase n=1 Tax=Chelativorans alearense TaxID=2681495 RepID=UPI0013D12668|nr:class I SAM-dependent methyltransferase [Chelativorans alearense]